MKSKIHESLRYLREANGLKQKDIAKELGITRQAYTRYENMQREPGLDIVMQLSEFYSISPSLLLYGVNSDSILDDVWDDLTALSREYSRRVREMRDYTIRIMKRNIETQDETDTIKLGLVLDDSSVEMRKDLDVMFDKSEKIRKRIQEMVKDRSLGEMLDDWYY